MVLRINRFLPFTRAEGPGNRACLWVQGCPIRCPGCAVPWTWPDDGGQTVSVADLAEQILNGPEIEGVTFLGGEPFAQAKALASLGTIVKEAGLSIVTFTGYELDFLQGAQDDDLLDLLHITDLLIAGPFRRECLDLSRPWVGSSNKQFHFLTDRYSHIQERLKSIPNRMEIRLLPSGEVRVNGMFQPAHLAFLRDVLHPASNEHPIAHGS